jgi:hypothetical protein
MKRVPENDDVRNGAKKALMRGLLPHCYVRVGERASLLEIAARHGEASQVEPGRADPRGANALAPISIKIGTSPNQAALTHGG